MEFMIGLVMYGAIVALASVLIYAALCEKWEVASYFIASCGAAAVGAVFVFGALSLTATPHLFDYWMRWVMYMVLLGAIFGFFTGLVTTGLWEGLRRNGWEGIVLLLTSVGGGTIINIIALFAVAWAYARIFEIFGLRRW